MSDIINPLLAKLHKSDRMPGVTYRLPSRGLTYTNGELADEVVDGEILVFPMSTLDEIYLRTPDMLFQGTAVEQTLSRCCPQILKPMDLLSKDVDFILTAMRQVSYGDIMNVPYKCDCPKAREVELNVPISGFLKKTKEITDGELNGMTFEVNGFVFKTKYVTFRKMVEMNQTARDMESPDGIYDSFINNLVASIATVDAYDDEALIKEFVNKLDRTFQYEILNNIQNINVWGMKLEHEFVCKYCAKTKVTGISLNPVSFFSQPSSQVDQT